MKLMLKTVVLLVLLLPMAGNSAVLQSSVHALHTAIFKEYDSRDYTEAAVLLNRLKEEDPARYSALPYGLLHARTLTAINKPREAFALYQSLSQDKRLAPFVLLPLARMAAQQGSPNTAVQYYQEYLRHAYPDYIAVAREALDYCWQNKKADLLYSTAQLLEQRSTMFRLAQVYLARAYILQNKPDLARNLLTHLISATKKDDVTNFALTDLDSLDGGNLSAFEKERRGRMAYDVWNFELSRKYLEPIATQTMPAAYHYARTLFFLGDFEQSRRAFQVALGLWPDDPMYEQALYQYANVFLRERNYEKAAELYKQLREVASGEMRETAAFKMIYSLRAQGKNGEALQGLEPYTRSGNLTARGKALSLKGRIYLQMGRHQDAFNEFQRALSLKPYRSNKELLLWKGIALEKLNRAAEARTIYRTVAQGHDFFSYKARERVDSQVVSPSTRNLSIRLPQLPDASQEETILSEYSSGNPLPALLYLRLYEEAGLLLPDIDRQTWKVLNVNSSDRLQRFLTIAYLGALGENYATATYYSELFLKNLPSGTTLFALSPEVQKTLFPMPYKEEIEQFSRERKLDPFLVVSIMKQESKFKRFARSQSFARGLMQIIPSTALKLAAAVGLQNFSVDHLYLPQVNINLGTRYLQDLMQEFGSEVEFLAAGYNGGEPNVRRWRDSSAREDVLDFVSSIDFKETKNYVMIVKSNYEMYRQIYREPAASASVPPGSSSKP